MVTFLSEEWIDALDKAAAGSGVSLDPGAGDGFAIEQVVKLGDGEIVYHVAVTPTGAGVALGPHNEPTVRFTADRETAAAIHGGVESAQAAFRMGRLAVEGDLGALEQRRHELDRLDEAFRPVRALTEL